MKSLLQLLEYTFWANDLFISRLSPKQDLSDDIQRLMSHLLSTHRLWLTRIAGRGTLPSAWDTVEQDNWEGVNIELYNETSNLVKSMDLDLVIQYKSSDGLPLEDSLGNLIHHIINHSTHHRAQVALLMREQHMLPPQSDYFYYLRR